MPIGNPEVTRSGPMNVAPRKAAGQSPLLSLLMGSSEPNKLGNYSRLQSLFATVNGVRLHYV